MRLEPKDVTLKGEWTLNISWNDHQRELRARYAQIGTSLTERASGTARDDNFDLQGWKVLGNEGLWRLPVADQYGGLDGTWWDFAAGFEGLASTVGDLGFLLSIIAHVGCIRALIEYGNESQKARFLPDLLESGIGATAITEEGGGSDVARIRTSASQVEWGYRLMGAKAHITNAPITTTFILVGRIPRLGEHDITLFLLSRDMPGINFGEQEQMFGNGSSPTGEIILNDVDIDEAHILGHKGDGLQMLYNIISLDRMLYGLIAQPFIEPYLNEALSFIHQRHAFKRALAEHQYVQQKIVDIKTASDIARYISYVALAKLIENDPEASALCSMAKLLGTEGMVMASMHLMQLFGHSGYMEGRITKLMRDVMGTRIAGGTSDIQRINIFNRIQ